MVKQLLLTAAMALSLSAAAQDSYSVVFSTPAVQVNLNNLNSDERVATIAQGAEYISGVPSSTGVLNNTTGFKFGASDYFSASMKFQFSEAGAVPATSIKLNGPVTANWQITVNGTTPSVLGADGTWTPTAPVILETLEITTTVAGRQQSLTGFTVYYDAAAKKDYTPDFKTYYVCSANKLLNVMPTGDHPTFTWTVADPSVARISNGFIQGLKAGETNVSVSWAENDTYLAGETSFRLYVVDGDVQPLEALTVKFATPTGTIPVNAENFKEYVAEGSENIGTVKQAFGLYATDYGLKFGSSSETGYLDFTTFGPMAANFVTQVKLNFFNDKTSGATLYLNNKAIVENASSDWDGTYTFDVPTRISSLYLTTRYYYLESIEFMYDPNINIPEEEKADYVSGLPTSATVYIDEPLQLKPAAGPALTYTSSNESIVTVSADGEISGVAPGEAVVTVAWGDKAYKTGSQEIAIDVKAARQPNMFYSAAAATAYLGVEPKLPELAVIPYTATPYVRYSSSDPTVATILPESGTISIKKVGTATITAKVTANCPWKLPEASYELTVEEFVMPNNVADATDIVSGGYVEGTATYNPEKAFKPLSSLTVDGVKVDIALEDIYEAGVTDAYQPSYQVGYEYKMFRFRNVMTGNYNLQPVLTFTAPEGKKLTKITMLGVPYIVNASTNTMPASATVTFYKGTIQQAFVTNISSGEVQLIDETGLPGINREIVWSGEGAETVSFQLYNKISSTYDYNIVNIAFEYEGENVEHAPFSYVVYPENGATIEALDKVTVTVPENEVIAITGKATLSNGVDTIELPAATVEGNVATFTLAEPITAAAKWTFAIEAGNYTYNGVPQNEQITASWTIPAAREHAPFSYVIFPESGTTIENLEYVTVTVPENEVIAVSGKATLSNGTKTIEISNVTVVDNVATFTLPEILDEEGTWTFALPTDAFTYNGEAQTEAVTASWTIPTKVSVSELGANGLVTVIGIDGVCVLRDADASALKTLAPGLYLVNGRKLLIRR